METFYFRELVVTDKKPMYTAIKVDILQFENRTKAEKHAHRQIREKYDKAFIPVPKPSTGSIEKFQC